jgi:hypothetical protein
MRFTWKGNWKKGEITIEADTLDELNNALNQLFSLGEVEEYVEEIGAKEAPALPVGLGCSDAIRTLLQSEWGRQPRSMKEIQNALEANALYFSKGTLSGTLTTMTKTGSLRRFKRGGRWVYVLR